MNLLVKSFAPDEELQDAIQQINALSGNINPFKMSLSNESRNGMRVVGTSRLGLVDIVSKLATQYDEKLAKNESAADLSVRLAYMRTLRAYKLALQNLCELIDDTDKALGVDIMAYADKFSNSLRNARKYEGDLDEAMKELDDYNARFGKIIEEEDKENKTNDINSEA